jgi:hypothetical protein
MANVAMVHYTLQDENKKDIQLYMIPDKKSDSLIVQDILNSFPASGRFHLRFRTQVAVGSNSETVWLDCPNPNFRVPLLKGNVVIKALQLPPFTNQALRKPVRKLYRETTTHVGNQSNYIEPTRIQQSVPRHPSTSIPNSGSDSSPPASVQPPQRPQPTFTHPPSQAAPQPPSQPSPQPIFNKAPPQPVFNQPSQPVFSQPPQPVFNKPSHSSFNQPPNATFNQVPGPNFANFSHAPPRPKSSGPPQHSHPAAKISTMKSDENFDDPTRGLTTEELRAEKEKFIQEQMEVKKEAARQTWSKAEAIQQAKFDLDRDLGDKMTSWAIKNHNKKDIRTLLATLHTVMWPNSPWKEISLGDLMTDSAVKKFYYKAVMVVHPDKRQNDEALVQYISERVFQALNEAWEKYNSDK